MNRRTFVGAAAGAGVAATAGCIGVLTGSEAIKREASSATIEQSTLDDTGYELADTSTKTIERTFDTPVGERDAKAVNEIAEYNRSVQLGTEDIRAAVLGVLATPSFDFGGKTFNPIGDMDNDELAKTIQGQYGGLSVDGKVGERTIDTLGKELEFTQFEGSGTVEGIDVPAYIHVGKVKHDSDYVVPLSVYPQELDDEIETVATLVGDLEH